MDRRYNIFTEATNGSIDLVGDEVKYALAGKMFRVKRTYIASIQLLADLALNKARVKMEYYTLGGEKQSVEFIMSKTELAGLKAAIGR